MPNPNYTKSYGGWDSGERTDEQREFTAVVAARVTGAAAVATEVFTHYADEASGHEQMPYSD